MKIPKEIQHELFQALEKIPGGYVYSGACSIQWCFPLKAGGELRFSICDEDEEDIVNIDLYSGLIPPGVSGPAKSTGG